MTVLLKLGRGARYGASNAPASIKQEQDDEEGVW